MIDPGYKIRVFLSRTAIPALVLWAAIFSGRALADPEDDRITLATLRRVESIAGRMSSLESFGKATLSESAILLDLGAASEPGLLQYLGKSGKDWKAKFWAVDMLGYVGDESALTPLRKLARNSEVRSEIRNRARKALKEIGARLSASR